MTSIDPVLVELIAARVVELLRQEDPPASAGLIDAAEAARRLGVSRATIYAKAGQLGAVRLGDGPRARLRFDPSVLAQRLAPRGRQGAPKAIGAADGRSSSQAPRCAGRGGSAPDPGTDSAMTAISTSKGREPSRQVLNSRAMARPASGAVIERRTQAGVTFALRFRAYGDRHYVTLGTQSDGWTRKRAETELANVQADVRRGL